jgi:hypothetical protein
MQWHRHRDRDRRRRLTGWRCAGPKGHTTCHGLGIQALKLPSHDNLRTTANCIHQRARLAPGPAWRHRRRRTERLRPQVAHALAAMGHHVDVLTRCDDAQLPACVFLRSRVRVFNRMPARPSSCPRKQLLPLHAIVRQEHAADLAAQPALRRHARNFFMSGWVGMALQRPAGASAGDHLPCAGPGAPQHQRRPTRSRRAHRDRATHRAARPTASSPNARRMPRT